MKKYAMKSKKRERTYVLQGMEAQLLSLKRKVMKS